MFRKKILQNKTKCGKKYMGLNCYSNFPRTSNPFFIRGGNYNNETNAGVFYFNNNTGNNNSNRSFRVVVPVLRYKGKLKID